MPNGDQQKAMRPPRLSVLDTAMVGSGTTTHQALEATVKLAQHAENLGFTRYWMAEHHGVPGVASSAPVVTIGALAAATRSIHVGAGGVMLPNHVPLVVAEQFSTLAALYPGRIDLGVGRATPDPGTAMVLARSLAGYGSDQFTLQLGQLAGFLRGDFPDGHPYRDVFVSPRAEEPPALWILGASVQSAGLAASLGLPFAFAHHFGRGEAAPAFEHYRRSFKPSAALSEPYAIVTALVVCAPSDEEADQIARSADLMFRLLFQGRPGKLPSPEEVAAHPWTQEDLAFVRQRRRGQAIGSPETVRSVLTELLEATGADELMMTTQMYRLEDRIRSLEMVSEMFIHADMDLGRTAP
ncbi:luciferase oxidoreductase, group 1 family protein [Paraburkholderia xenovorans LB400]|uniref:Luciferase-like monooxygenase n=1 Tax=Paraburkholderia xenovorans (strain LB400) TaxID=266265 RepID=Q140F7_PARXL|nr:LLM class flavin-dependent oxidoreductase [Paraburkholderia xenovorans]ABE30282.1 Putative luciferase-like monooxygenase [Paraburkholderia xenovorans LB400]AIP30884.1 luciferase oxidoreductase, group 1 family protein [Paraburkholderia xenovorans LB400]